MRTLLALAICISGILSLGTSADAARKRSAKPRDYASQPRHGSRHRVECERARHADPTGLYAGYPCWAREAFSPRNEPGRTH